MRWPRRAVTGPAPCRSVATAARAAGRAATCRRGWRRGRSTRPSGVIRRRARPASAADGRLPRLGRLGGGEVVPAQHLHVVEDRLRHELAEQPAGDAEQRRAVARLVVGRGQRVGARLQVDQPAVGGVDRRHLGHALDRPGDGDVVDDPAVEEPHRSGRQRPAAGARPAARPASNLIGSNAVGNEAVVRAAWARRASTPLSSVPARSLVGGVGARWRKWNSAPERRAASGL